MKLTELQHDKLRTAYHNAQAVLREVKTQVLAGKSLKFMKTLEEGVQHLEVAVMQGVDLLSKRKK